MSTRQLTDASQEITDGYTYDAFGILLNKFGATVNDYLYTGEQYDPNVGFYYLRARYYNASIGRFLTIDTWPGSVFEPASLHKYLYCEGNPVNYFDASGKHQHSLIEKIMIISGYAILASIVTVIVTRFISGAQTPVEWTGWAFMLTANSTGFYKGHPLGFGYVQLWLEGIHKTEDETRICKGSFAVILAGITLNLWDWTWMISETRFLTPGIFSARPAALAGPATYISLSGIMPLLNILGISIGWGFYDAIFIMGTGIMDPPYGMAVGQDVGIDVMGGFSFPIPGTFRYNSY